MTRQLRHLLAAPTASFQQPALEQVSSDFVVILAALLCALICFLGLVAVARCGRLRRLSDSSGSSQSQQQQQQPADKGLKKKVLRSLPTQPYSSEFADADCAICLAEFAEGDELRVLPPCGHGFHVACIDTWLGSHSSCPSCRHVLVVGRCSKCGKLPPVSAASGSEHVQSAATAPFLP